MGLETFRDDELVSLGLYQILAVRFSSFLPFTLDSLENLKKKKPLFSLAFRLFQLNNLNRS